MSGVSRPGRTDVSLSGESGSVLGVPAPGQRVVVWLRIMLFVSVILPLAFLAAYALITYRLALGDLEQLVQRTVDVMSEHTLKVFETQELILDQAAILLSGINPDKMGDTSDLNEALKRLQREREQIAGIFILDARGDLRAASRWRSSINAADRDYFQHFQAQPGDKGTFVGKAVTGRVTGRPAFGFSRGWPAPDGTFFGAIGVSVSADYFANFFHNTARDIKHLAALIRTDGEVLARDPPRSPPPVAVPSDDPLMRAIAHADRGVLWRASRSDGVERLYAFRHIDGYPLVVTMAVARSTMIAPWLKGLYLYASVSFVAALTLYSLTLFGLQMARREEEALARAASEQSKRAEIEARLRRSQKLEALGELTGGVAHDVGNLLTPIIGNLQLLQRGLDRPELMSLVGNALSAAELGRGLVTSLLTFARRQPQVLITLDVNAVMVTMQPLLLQSLGSKGTLVLRPGPALWPVEADAAQLEVAVLNLVVNARDALADHGIVTIATKNVTLAGENGEPDRLTGDFVALSVADNGSGMTADVLARVFEPFFTTKEPGKGTGLGLAMVYGFAKQSGGEVAVNSAVGMGTSVTIYLPRQAATPSVFVAAAPGAEAGHPG
jgi:signal transduction histidine kinase